MGTPGAFRRQPSAGTVRGTGGGNPSPRTFLLTADKTKTNQTRRVPLSTNVRAVLAMRRHAPNSKDFGADQFVFGNEVGEQIGSIKTAWRATCRVVAVANIRDLRRL